MGSVMGFCPGICPGICVGNVFFPVPVSVFGSVLGSAVGCPLVRRYQALFLPPSGDNSLSRSFACQHLRDVYGFLVRYVSPRDSTVFLLSFFD